MKEINKEINKQKKIKSNFTTKEKTYAQNYANQKRFTNATGRRQANIVNTINTQPYSNGPAKSSSRRPFNIIFRAKSLKSNERFSIKKDFSNKSRQIRDDKRFRLNLNSKSRNWNVTRNRYRSNSVGIVKYAKSERKKASCDDGGHKATHVFALRPKRQAHQTQLVSIHSSLCCVLTFSVFCCVFGGSLVCRCVHEISKRRTKNNKQQQQHAVESIFKG